MRIQRQYTDLNFIYSNQIETENYIINKISLSDSQVAMEKIRNRRNSWLVSGLKSNFDYIRLIKKGDGVMMSDTPMERNTNMDFINKANGDVIIFGLGLGLIILPLLKDSSVKSITVVELYQDLIDVVEPTIKQYDSENKLNIVLGDCFKYNIPKEKKYDTIYFDIWNYICLDDYQEHKILIKKYSKNLNKSNKNCFISAWLHSYYKKSVEVCNHI